MGQSVNEWLSVSAQFWGGYGHARGVAHSSNLALTVVQPPRTPLLLTLVNPFPSPPIHVDPSLSPQKRRFSSSYDIWVIANFITLATGITVLRYLRRWHSAPWYRSRVSFARKIRIWGKKFSGAFLADFRGIFWLIFGGVREFFFVPRCSRSGSALSAPGWRLEKPSSRVPAKTGSPFDENFEKKNVEFRQNSRSEVVPITRKSNLLYISAIL